MTLRLILGDQLNINHSWFSETDDSIHYCIFEMRQETDYVKHHIKKVLCFFLAMRNFSMLLREKGYRVNYLEINDPKNLQSLESNLRKLIEDLGVTSFQYQLPDEYRLDQQLKDIAKNLEADGVAVEVFDSEHFLTSRTELADFFGNKEYLMERFYRHMRKKHHILMDGHQPLGGSWNYDKQNRNKLPRNHKKGEHLFFERDVSWLVKELENSGVKTIGNIEDGKINWPVTREESLLVLNCFTQNLLVDFGTYQDAMSSGDSLVFHSLLSFSLNVKLISPEEVIREVERYFLENENIEIAQAEGFIRQILGWREYMRGVYWAKMPEYADLNYFEHNRPLPLWYWSGETSMNCLHKSITQSLDLAYAHHIQRLMITGNFALLAACHPDEVDQWYLGVYIDAIEWVEITNTRGMSQYADGGLLATKPYISSSNYINKMSDYCSGCKYDRKKRTGENACPFNTLYWYFLASNRSRLEKNPRMGMMYRLLDKISDQEMVDITKRAESLMENIDSI